MRFLVNTPKRKRKRAAAKTVKSVRYNGRSVSKSTWKASGFSRNPKKPTARQLAARKKFAAMARARAAGARKIKRAQTSTEVIGMARRKRRAVATRRGPARRRRSSTARRRVYAANPRRHKRRRSTAKVSRRRYRRNPGGFSVNGIIGDVKDLAIGAGAGLAGMAIGKTVSGMIPINSTNPQTQPIFDFAKGVVVAVGIQMIGKRFVGRDLARIAAIGALLNPTKNLVTSYAPSLSPYLGDAMFLPAFATPPRRLSAYAGTGMQAYPNTGMAAYPPPFEQ